jgi:hypothetical protein
VGSVSLAALLALLCLAWPASSQAEGRRLLVLLAPQEPVFWPWLRAELGSSGFAVRARNVAVLPPGPQEIEVLATRESTSIGLSLLETGNGIEIWLVDPLSHRLAFRELILGLYQPTESPDVIAVRMVETLRATLMELAQEHRTSEPVPARSHELSAAPATPARSRFTLGVAAGGAFSPGGVGAIGYLDLSLGWAISSRFGLLVDAALTPIASRVRGAEGTANLDFGWAGAALSFNVTNPNAPLCLRSGAGAWLALLGVTGQAVAPYENRRTFSLSTVPHVDLGLRWSLTRRLGLGADLSAGFSTPGMAIDFAGREQATWGRPLWLGGLSLETSLD